MTNTTSVTIQNIEAAFAGESMAHIKYLYFARIARNAGDEPTGACSRKPPRRRCSTPSAISTALPEGADDPGRAAWRWRSPARPTSTARCTRPSSCRRCGTQRRRGARTRRTDRRIREHAPLPGRTLDKARAARGARQGRGKEEDASTTAIRSRALRPEPIITNRRNEHEKVVMCGLRIHLRRSGRQPEDGIAPARAGRTSPPTGLPGLRRGQGRTSIW